MYDLGASEGGSKSELRGWNFQGINLSLNSLSLVREMAASITDLLLKLDLG